MNGEITALYASLLGLLLVLLSLRVALYRKKNQIGIGTNGDTTLDRRIRVQANLIEYAPIALLLLYFCEIRGVSHIYIHLFGTVLVVARLLHAYGLNRSAGYSLARFLGTLTTFFLIIFLCGVNIVHYFTG